MGTAVLAASQRQPMFAMLFSRDLHLFLSPETVHPLPVDSPTRREQLLVDPVHSVAGMLPAEPTHLRQKSPVGLIRLWSVPLRTARGCPNTRQARRCDTRTGPKRRRTSLTVRRRRSGPTNFPSPLPWGSPCPGPVGDQLFQPAILLLQCLEFLGHLRVHTAVLLPPAVVGLNRDLQDPADLRDGLPLPKLHVGSKQFRNDLIHRASVLHHR